MVLGAASAGAIDVKPHDHPTACPDDKLELGPQHLLVTRRDIEDVARAFGFDPHDCAPCDVELDTIEAVAVAHDLLGLKPEQYRETGLMLAQRQSTWREFDSARRLGAQTFELQRILLKGLFNEPGT